MKYIFCKTYINREYGTGLLASSHHLCLAYKFLVGTKGLWTKVCREWDHSVRRNDQLSSGRELLVKRKHTSHCVLIDGAQNDTGVTTARNFILLKRPAHPVVSQPRWTSVHGVHSTAIGTRPIQCVQSDVVNIELGVRYAQDCRFVQVWKGHTHIHIYTQPLQYFILLLLDNSVILTFIYLSYTLTRSHDFCHVVIQKSYLRVKSQCQIWFKMSSSQE